MSEPRSLTGLELSAVTLVLTRTVALWMDDSANCGCAVLPVTRSGDTGPFGVWSISPWAAVLACHQVGSPSPDISSACSGLSKAMKVLPPGDLGCGLALCWR